DRRGRSSWPQFRLLAARLLRVARHDFERRVAYGSAEELALVVGHLQEPARPPPRIASGFGIGQVAHDRQRLLARRRSVRQLDAFLVRQDALPEPEMEKIARHVVFPSTWRTNSRRLMAFPKGQASRISISGQASASRQKAATQIRVGSFGSV